MQCHYYMEIMKKVNLIALTAVMATAGIANAKGNINGNVYNAESGDPMDFVTVQLWDAKTNKPLQINSVTDSNGAFILQNVPDGSYIVKITNVGSVNQERPVTVKGGDVSIGKVNLTDDAKLLKEVIVEGIRSQMRFELDKKVFQVDSNIASAGSSASELLESIPSVEVDQDGEVSLRGDTSVTIWINGKDSGLTSDNRAQILEQIPAESIERIEVITNPSAKYNPEGTSGIINIILKKSRRAGYFGSAELSANTRGGGNASVNINLNKGKWDSYASVGFRMRHNKGGSVMRRDFLNGDFVHSDGSSKNHGNNLFVRLGTTFHLTDNDDFYLNGFGMFGHRWGHSETNYLAQMPNQWIRDYQHSSNKGDNRGAHGELGYTHKWNDNHSLEAMISYNYWGGPSHDEYSESEEWPDTGSGVPDPVKSYRRQEMDITNNTWEARLDYSNVLNQYLKIEAGYNGNYNHENTPNTTYRGMTSSDATLDPALYNRFIYNNNVSALYFTLGGKAGIFSYSAGLRGEAWQIRSRSLAYGQNEADVPEYKRNKFSLFPSVYMSLALPHDNELQINYTRRIRRPRGGQLNSFRNISDPTSISYGNPELEPQYSNSFEINYLKSWTYHLLSVSAYMRQSSNIMNQVSYMDGDVMYSTWGNMASRINSGLELVGKNQLFKGWLDLTTTVNLYHSYISAWDYSIEAPSGQTVTMSGKKQNSFAWDARMMANVKLPWDMSFQATGRYSSEHKTATGSHQGGWSVDAGLRKILGNWSFSLNCRDIFNSRKWKNTVNGIDYSQYSERWRSGRTLRLTIKYSFGNMKAKRDKHNSGDEPMEQNYSGEGME